ncbi:MAG: Asp-tRNA(Asn)/Glu-tRNA(Gln) amidotransferase subunit GatB [Chitinophagaceae bacterium]
MGSTQTSFEAVIGLEVHVQLLTQSKLFSSDPAHVTELPNAHVSPIVLAHPGTLPRMNKKAIEGAVKMGLVCGSTITRNNYFARKNYFYPDLPKGYQISQHTHPICEGGAVNITTSSGKRAIRLTRIHLEEDAGKSMHDQHPALTYLDYNRAGVALIEIVSEPEMHSADEAAAYLTQIRKLVKWIGICDGNMEEGSIRCDANVSVRRSGITALGTRVEVKNLNSIRHLKHAIQLEIDRLISMVERGESVVQETRSYDADAGTTFSIRTKENADDYRYFPEPDLPLFIVDEVSLEAIQKELPVLPDEKFAHYCAIEGLTAYDAEQLTEEISLSTYFDLIAGQTAHKKTAVNVLLGPVKSYLNETGLQWNDLPDNPKGWCVLLELIATNQVSFSQAVQTLLPAVLIDPTIDVVELAGQKDILQNTNIDDHLSWVESVIMDMPEKVLEYRKGKKGLIGLFVGEVKKRSKGKADPKKTTELLMQTLDKN